MADSARPKIKRNIFSKTKFYVFEYTVFQLAILSLGAAFATAIFIMFNVFAGNTTVSNSLDGLVWVFGLSLVLVPLTVVLYARTSTEEALHPARHKQTPRKFVFYSMLTIATVTAISFLITSVYTVSRVAFGLSETKSLVEIVLPSLVMLLLTAYYIFAVHKNFAPAKKLRKTNILVMSILGGIVVCSILILASLSSADLKKDKQITADLSTTQKAINSYYSSNSKMPDNTVDLKDLDSTIKNKFTSGQYKYEVVPLSVDYASSQEQYDNNDISSYSVPSIQYRLCATFYSDKSYYGNYYDSGEYNNGDLSIHKKGYQCFDLYIDGKG